MTTTTTKRRVSPLTREKARERMLALPESERRARLDKARAVKQAKAAERKAAEEAEREEMEARLAERVAVTDPAPASFREVEVDDLDEGAEVIVTRTFESLVANMEHGAHRIETGEFEGRSHGGDLILAYWAQRPTRKVRKRIAVALADVEKVEVER